MTQTDPLLQAARQIAAAIRPRNAEIEQARRLPADIAQAMARAGLYRALLPPDLGGAGAAPALLLQVIETIAAGDAAAGWCLMIGATTATSAGRLPDAVAHTVFGDPAGITAGVFAPMGRARPDAGGWRVSGRWAWGSGSQTAAWIFAGCLVLDGAADAEGQPTPRRLANGQPDVVMMILPATQLQFHDTWQAVGLGGSGSLDFEARDLLVPQDFCVSLLSSPVRRPGLGFAFPVFGLLSLGIAAVALGIARRALDEFAALAGAKTPQGSGRKLAERAMVQADYARAEAAVLAARALLFDSVARASDHLREAAIGAVLPLADKIALRRAATHATHVCAEAVRQLYLLAGGSAVYQASPLQRAFRDAHVATQHMMTGPATWEVIGRAGLGLPVDDTQL